MSRSRAVAAIGSTVWFFLAPGSVTVWVPWLLTRWVFRAPFPGWAPFRALGVFLLVVGLVLIIDSFVRFVRDGFGTPAPVLPPKHLVVTGAYRHVRNPMYVAIVCMALGQGFLLGAPLLFLYAGLIGVVFHLFIIGYEEPTLRRRFGAEYDPYTANVRRWWPRLSPWPPSPEGGGDLVTPSITRPGGLGL